jgi:hypothetical protein
MDSDWFWITETRIAEVLIRPETFRYFSVFFQARTLVQAAKVLDVPPSSLKYHLDKFLGWGLVRIVSTPRKVYQVVAKRFFIPFQITNFASLEELLFEQQLEWEKQFLTDQYKAAARMHPNANLGGVCIQVLDDVRWSIDYSVSQDPKVEPVPQITDTAWSSRTTLYLTFEQAQAVQRELADFWQRLLEQHKHPQEQTKAYSLRLGLTEKF